MDSYIEASPRGRWIFLICIFVFAVIFVSATSFDKTLEAPTENLELEIQSILDRAFFSTVYQTFFYLGTILVVVWLGSSSIKSRQWPPHGFAVPFKTKIRPIENPARIWVFIFLVAAAKSFGLYSCWQRYFWLVESVKGLIK